jgi:hypothetical protein
MNAPPHLDLLGEILEHEVVDSDGVSCVRSIAQPSSTWNGRATGRHY